MARPETRKRGVAQFVRASRRTGRWKPLPRCVSCTAIGQSGKIAAIRPSPTWMCLWVVRAFRRRSSPQSPVLRHAALAETKGFAVTLLFSIALTISSLLMIVLILMHKGRGGGLSDMFGGGISSSLGGSRLPSETSIASPSASQPSGWSAIVALGLLLKVSN